MTATDSVRRIATSTPASAYVSPYRLISSRPIRTVSWFDVIS